MYVGMGDWGQGPNGYRGGGHPSKKQGASKKGFLEELLRSKVDGTICGTIHHYGAALGRVHNKGWPPSAAPLCCGEC